ncbi:MAG: HEAT repeat domain-containing protein, partial [Bdellovibrionales bacterium]|nr:HEAT repeat domain-containing protein [Bdellovibrionales bacterium]
PQQPEVPVAELTEKRLSSLPPQQLAWVATSEEVPVDTLRSAIGVIAEQRGLDFTRLLASLSRHDDFRVRVDAMKGLQKNPHASRDEALQALAARLDDQDFLVRAFAAKILGEIQNPGARKYLLARRDSESNEKVIQQIDKALESLGAGSPSGEVAR